MTCFILPKKPRRVCARRRKESRNHFLRRRVRRREYRSARKRAKGVPFVRCSEPQPLSNESPVKRVSFESVSKRLFRHAQAPRVRRCPDQNVMGRCGRSAPPHGGIFRTVRGSFTPRGALDTGYGFHFLSELAVRSALARCRKMFQDCVRFQYAPARQNNARRVGSFFSHFRRNFP